MKIRTRLTILFTIVTASILLGFACVIYYSAKESREKEFYTLLKKEAYTKANVFLNAQVDKETLQEIYLNNRQILNEVEVAIYDTSMKLLYHDAVDIDFVKETDEMLQRVLRKRMIRFYQDKWQVVGVRYHYQGQDYIVTAAAYDQYGYTKLDTLLKTIILVFVISILVIYIAGWLFSRRAFKPIKEMTDRTRNISATNLDLRLEVNGSKDELSELANTFNQMLNRLESSFDAQKHFVSNISHELRTPLAAIIAELELSANKERSVEEYKGVVYNVLMDAKKLARLSGSLLDLAKASYDPSEISFRPTRVDEVLLDARHRVQRANLGYRVDIYFEDDFEDEDHISVDGNAYLLKVAFANLFENGCKFSDNKRSAVSVLFADKHLILKFSDSGIGIAQNDLEDIFIPFYRGENGEHTYGHGIGLSLTQKIIRLHNGDIAVYSQEQVGTTFTVTLPHR